MSETDKIVTVGIEVEDRTYTLAEAYDAAAGASLAGMYTGMLAGVKAVVEACAQLGVTLPLKAARIAADICADRLGDEDEALRAAAPGSPTDRGAN